MVYNTCFDLYATLTKHGLYLLYTMAEALYLVPLLAMSTLPVVYKHCNERYLVNPHLRRAPPKGQPVIRLCVILFCQIHCGDGKHNTNCAVNSSSKLLSRLVRAITQIEPRLRVDIFFAGVRTRASRRTRVADPSARCPREASQETISPERRALYELSGLSPITEGFIVINPG